MSYDSLASRHSTAFWIEKTPRLGVGLCAQQRQPCVMVGDDGGAAVDLGGSVEDSISSPSSSAGSSCSALDIDMISLPDSQAPVWTQSSCSSDPTSIEDRF